MTVGTQSELRDDAELWVRDARYSAGAWQHIGSVRRHPNRGYRFHNLAGYPTVSGEEAQYVISEAITAWRKEKAHV